MYVFVRMRLFASGKIDFTDLFGLRTGLALGKQDAVLGNQVVAGEHHVTGRFSRS